MRQLCKIFNFKVCRKKKIDRCVCNLQMMIYITLSWHYYVPNGSKIGKYFMNMLLCYVSGQHIDVDLCRFWSWRTLSSFRRSASRASSTTWGSTTRSSTSSGGGASGPSTSPSSRTRTTSSATRSRATSRS